MLPFRSVCFAACQGILALNFLLLGESSPWNLSEGYWVISGLMTNVLTFYVLSKLFKQEGIKYFDHFRFVKKGWQKDLLISIGILLVSMPIATFPNFYLADKLLGSTEASFQLFFRPLPLWIILIGIFWPLTQGLVELPVYFSYCMPRIENRIKSGWTAWILASFFLALQHAALPLIFNTNFILWRLGMFLLFALFIGLSLKIRPRLFPYLMISHALMDFMILGILFSTRQ